MLQGVERLGQFFQGGVFTSFEYDPDSISTYREQTVFSQPASSLREAELQQRQTSSSPSQQNQQGTTAQARLSGQNVSDISDDSTLIGGGSRLSISGDSVTFENISGDTLTLEADTEARIYRGEDGGLTIQNRTSGEEITVSADETVTVGGEGTATLEGNSRSIELESGEELLARQSGANSTELVRSGEADSIAISEEETAFSVSEDSLSFLGASGQTIRFEAGEAGTITKSESGELTITNSSSEESVTFEAGQELSVFGLGEGVLGEDEMEISGPGSLNISTDASGNLNLVNPETAPSTEINPLEEVQEPQKPLQLEVFSNPELERLQTLQSELIQRPLEEQREAEEKASEETEEDSVEEAEKAEETPDVDREETEQAEITEQEEVAPASFNEENSEAAMPASLRADEENETAAIQNSEKAAENEAEEEETFDLPEVKLELLEEDEEETTKTVQDFESATQTAPAEIDKDEMADRLTSLYASASGSAQDSETATLYA
ncbi:MAG: hypothetical protein ACLFN5_02070 [bacterium]